MSESASLRPCFADALVQRTVTIDENVPIARDTFRLRFSCAELARSFLPGQFLMLRLHGWDDPLIGRPFALYDTVLDAAGQPEAVDIVYLVKGKLTTRLATLAPGRELQVWGPLGNGFPPQPAERLVMVAGGIGQTPFLALGQEYLGRRQYGVPARTVPPARRVTLCYGARTAELLAGVPDFDQAGIDVRLCTDDGSRGRRGLVTELLAGMTEAELGEGCLLACCGPEPMMAAVAAFARERQLPCLVSLETPMACGIGICFSCVTRVRENDHWDYRRTCVEGPVFDASRIVW